MSSSLISHGDLPLIDVSQFPSVFDCEAENNPALLTVREACKEWGFFCITNHGVSDDLLQQVELQTRRLCSAAPEAKQRAATSNLPRSYHRLPKEIYTMLNLPESGSIEELSNKIWPEEGRSTNFSQTFRKYSSHMADLTQKICKIVLASLGLDAEKFYDLHFKKCTSSIMRINHYVSDAESVDQEILFAHRDMTCFTILYQDNEGGLQVRSKEGGWLSVKPISGSFIVNLGDSFKAWSNGRYRSAEHRVVCENWAERFSVPYFVFFKGEKEIWAPDELVDDEHPRRYRALIASQFEKDYMNYLKLKDEKATAFFERYAAIKINISPVLSI